MSGMFLGWWVLPYYSEAEEQKGKQKHRSPNILNPFGKILKVRRIMKRLLNVLYILTENQYLSKQGETICVHVGGAEKYEYPFTLWIDLCFGDTTVSTPLIAFCGEKHRACFLQRSRPILWTHWRASSEATYCRTKQYCHPYWTSPVVSKNFVATKIANERNAAYEVQDSNNPETVSILKRAAQDIACLSSQLKTAENLDQVRGIEGIAANRYLPYSIIWLRQTKKILLSKRSKTPLDRVNSFSLFLYMPLSNDVRSAPWRSRIGSCSRFLTCPAARRPSLARI